MESRQNSDCKAEGFHLSAEASLTFQREPDPAWGGLVKWSREEELSGGDLQIKQRAVMGRPEGQRLLLRRSEPNIEVLGVLRLLNQMMGKPEGWEK